MAVKKGSDGGEGTDPSEPGATSARSRTGEKAFDHWLRTRLHQIFDRAMTDEVPADLLDLVRQLEERERRGHH